MIALEIANGMAKTTGRNGSGGQRGCESHHQSPDNDHALLSFYGDKNVLLWHILSNPA